MKNMIYVLIALLVLSAASSQPTTGIVTYVQINKLDFETFFDEQDLQRVTDYLGGELPQSSKAPKRLVFSETASLFENDPDGAASDVRLKNIQLRMDMRRPRPKLEKVYFDFDNNQKIEQVEFMTRYFRIVNEIDKPAWKLSDKHTKILDYICMGAELQKGEDVYIAYFTSEIPVSLGPDEFIGLPGLVLAVEKNGETVYLATSIELGPLEEAISEPQDGKKVTQCEFDDILKNKVREFEETKQKERRSNRR